MTQPVFIWVATLPCAAVFLTNWANVLRRHDTPSADLYCLLHLTRKLPVQFRTQVESALKRIFEDRNLQKPSLTRPLMAPWLVHARPVAQRTLRGQTSKRKKYTQPLCQVTGQTALSWLRDPKVVLLNGKSCRDLVRADVVLSHCLIEFAEEHDFDHFTYT